MKHIQTTLLLLCFLFATVAHAKSPTVCPLTTEAELLQLAKQKSAEALLSNDFRKIGKLAREGVFYADNCLKKNPRSVGCYYYRGVNRGLEIKTRATSVNKELQKMIKDFNKVIQMNKRYDDGGAYVALGYLYLKAPAMPMISNQIKRDLDLASQYAQKAIRIAPNNPYNITLIGEIALKKKEYKTALNFFKQAQNQIKKNKKLNREDLKLKKELKKFVKKTKRKT